MSETLRRPRDLPDHHHSQEERADAHQLVDVHRGIKSASSHEAAVSPASFLLWACRRLFTASLGSEESRPEGGPIRRPGTGADHVGEGPSTSLSVRWRRLDGKASAALPSCGLTMRRGPAPNRTLMKLTGPSPLMRLMMETAPSPPVRLMTVTGPLLSTGLMTWKGRHRRANRVRCRGRR